MTPSYPVEYVGWWPDPLLPPGPFAVDAGDRQPLWFRVDVPPEAKPGRYAGEVTIRHGDEAVSIPVELHVRSFRLPRPGTLLQDAEPLCLVPETISRTMTSFTKDPQELLERRRRLGNVIEQLDAFLRGD